MQWLPAMILLGVIVLLSGTVGEAAPSAPQAARPAPETGVQAATSPALLLAADRAAPRKLPCPYCPKKQKQSGCIATCSATSLGPASDAVPLTVTTAAMAIQPSAPLAGIARPPDPPPPKS